MKLILALLLLTTSIVNAQMYAPIQKTNLNKFIADKNIEWAIYKNDTLLTTNPDLKNILINKAIAQKIKIFENVAEGTIQENDLHYYGKANQDKLFENESLVAIYNNDGENVGTKVINSKKELTNPVGELWLSEILYTKNGTLSSQINSVSPSYNVITDIGTNLGNARLFSTALNTKQTNFNTKTDKIIYLTTTTKDLYVDSIKKEDKLKEMYGHNLIEILWPYVANDKIKMFNVADNKQTTLKDINTQNLLNLESINIPLYDSIGNYSGSKKIITETTPYIFYKITITQIWYYNDTKNIVFCKIPSAVITVKKYPNNYILNDANRQIKLVF